MPIVVIIRNGDGRPCAWGVAETEEEAARIAEQEWASHHCYSGEERGKRTARDLGSDAETETQG